MCWGGRFKTGKLQRNLRYGGDAVSRVFLLQKKKKKIDRRAYKR